MGYRSTLMFNEPYLRDPRRLPAMNFVSHNLTRPYAGATVNPSSTTFFTGDQGSIDRMSGGFFTSSAWTSDTWKTVASHTGAGTITGLLGPAASANWAFGFRVTLDGVMYTFVHNATTNGRRVYCGFLYPMKAYYTATTPVNYEFDSTLTPQATGFATAPTNTTDSLVVPSPNDIRMHSSCQVLYTKEMLVEMRIVSNNGQGSIGDYAAVIGSRFYNS